MFLLTACILTMITTISAPVVKNIALLSVTAHDATNSSSHPTFNMGVFGYCAVDLPPEQYEAPAPFSTHTHSLLSRLN